MGNYCLCSRTRRRDRVIALDRGRGRGVGHPGARHTRGGGTRASGTRVEAAPRKTGGAERATPSTVPAAEPPANRGNGPGRYSQ